MIAPDSLAPIEHKPPERSGPWANPIGIEGETSNTNTYFYLRAYWHILLKRRWTVLTVTFVLTTLVAIVTFKMQPVYEARATVELEAPTPQIQSLNDLDRASSIDQVFLETQAGIIESDSLAWRTIQQLKLGENPAFLPSLKCSEPRGGDAASATQVRLINVFRGGLRVERTMNSHLIKVHFESTDARLTAQVANALVNNYIEYN
ncbi:MAG: Wzz/FepE/Etk N-terminal domain-containing protein, partial [Candidatus Solibacter sp.]|nr:Wzz/FepE/Etk N-terminal domain-containing protein [Candidatus Solibacter sp.]